MNLRALGILALSTLFGAPSALALAPNDIADLSQWEGVEVRPPDDGDAQAVAAWSTPEAIAFTYPDGELGWNRVGLATAHDGSADWRPYQAVRFQLRLPDDELLRGQLTLRTAAAPQGSEKVPGIFTADFSLVGAGWQTVSVPLEAFNYEKDRPGLLFTAKGLDLRAWYDDGRAAELSLRDVRLVRAERVALHSDVRSRPARPGQDARYTLKLTNCTDVPQAVNLATSVPGREATPTLIEPDHLLLAPGATQSVEVRVQVSKRMPPGAHERQTVRAVANGQASGEIQFITVSAMNHPYILHTPERWDAVRQKMADHPWARTEADRLIERADGWEIPTFDHDRVSKRTHDRYLFGPRVHDGLLNCAIAYELTGDLKYAEKAAQFLKQLADPDTGYPATLQANNNNLVKEGGVFTAVGQAYDLIHDAGVLSETDHANLEITFRLYFDIIDEHLSRGTLSNWMVSEYLGAIFCALAIQDLAVVERFVEGPSGFKQTVSHGVMSDGWWFECSIGYNTWVAKMFTQVSLALQPWGYDYLDHAFPSTYSKEYNIPYAGVEQRMQDFYGMPFQKYGPVHRPYVKIKDLWDSLVPYIDYDGVMFAVNDSTEKKFNDSAYELAYAVYRDPRYASVIKLQDKRDLLYGVPDLPADTPPLGEGSASSDNAGVVMLRSRAKGQDPRERIQATLKYGTHGAYHGHFDRAGLNSLMRYGRSFYNPEHIWYSYPNFMYKFFVQTSLPHNMVVVDMKQQEPVDSKKLLFGTGEMMQTAAVETHARWSNPPYGGIYYENYFGRPFSDKIWDEGRYVPIPENAPRWGTIGPYSDHRVMQRRLMVVTDDYVVLADHLDSPEDQTFDCLFNIKGFEGLEADHVEHLRHTDQMDPDPLLGAQFITDCNWYQTTGTAKVGFKTLYGPGADNAGTRIYGLDGTLNMDVYSAWPHEREVMIGTLPEAHGVNRKFWYRVHGDDTLLAEGKFGAWVLGRDAIDVSIEGIETLTLTTKAEFNAKKAPKTLFWGDPVIVTADGTEVALRTLSPVYAGIDDSPKDGLDYDGGPVKIAGRPFARNLPANPTESEVDGTVTLDLTGLNAVRFKAHVGGDYPLGDETQRRKSLSFRTTGKTARFLTVIEPYEDQAVVKKVSATSADEVTVELVDGRTHVLSFTHLEQGTDLSVTIREYRAGELIREETSE